ncbi:hypothetical protein JCM8097_004665 [Rhodosporidiobolus ruineniae]
MPPSPGGSAPSLPLSSVTALTSPHSSSPPSSPSFLVPPHAHAQHSTTEDETSEGESSPVQERILFARNAGSAALAAQSSSAASGPRGTRKRSMSHASAGNGGGGAAAAAARRASILRDARRTSSAQWGEQSTSDDEGLHEAFPATRRLGAGAGGGPGRERTGSYSGPSTVGGGMGRRREVGQQQALAGFSQVAASSSTPAFATASSSSSPFAAGLSPFSRPPSAVTAPYAPSRPGSARPGSTVTARTARGPNGNGNGWGEGVMEEEDDWEEGDEEMGRRSDKGKGREVDSLPFPSAGGGNGQAVYDPPIPVDDPLDPLSSLRSSRSPFTASPSSASPFPSTTTPTKDSRSRTSSLHSTSRLGGGIPRPKGPPPPALRPPDPPSPLAAHHPETPTKPPSSASLSPDHHRLAFPASFPSTESLTSASASSFAGPSSLGSAGSSSHARSTHTSTAPQPSLQQLLQTVDLTAALKLVQTLQTQQTQQAKVASTVGAGTPTNTAVPAAGAVVEPVPAPLAPPTEQRRMAPSGTFIDFADLPPSGNAVTSPVVGPGAGATLATVSESPVSTLSPASGLPGSVEHDKGGEKEREREKDGKEKEGRKDRRTSLMGGLSKRLRTGSAASKLSAGAVTPEKEKREEKAMGVGMEKVPESPGLPPQQQQQQQREQRIYDERAMLGEAGRSFEEQISRVHLTLSPATLRRAQNAAKYLSLRYTPLYAALSASSPSSRTPSPAASKPAIPLPNPLEVARWRVAREEAERRNRRSTRLGGTGLRSSLRSTSGEPGAAAETGDGAESPPLGSTRLTELGSAKAGGAPSPYGPRRNKNPKVWEVYPDDIADFVASGGEVPEGTGEGPTRSYPHGAGQGRLPPGVEQLFYNPAAAAAGAEEVQQKANGNLARVPTKGSTASGGRGSVGDGGGTSPYSQHGPRPSTLSLSAGSASSIINGTPAPPVTATSRPRLPSSADSTSRPPSGLRQLSYEGSPFGRTTSMSSEAYPGSPLRRTTSLSTPAPGSPRSPRSPSQGPLGLSGLSSSPRSRLASAQASREDLPSSAVAEPGAGAGGKHHHRHSASVEGFRSGLSKRFDRIRGRTTDGDASDPMSRPSVGGRNGSAATGVHDFAYPSDPESHLLRSPSRRLNNGLSGNGAAGGTGNGSGNGALSDSTRRGQQQYHFPRPYLRKNATSVDLGRGGGFESDGFIRSSGDEGSGGGEGGRGGVWRRASRGLLANAWQGFKTSRDAYGEGLSAVALNGALGQGADGLLDEQRRREAEMRRRKILEEEEEESEEEEEERKRRPPREVVDVGDEDFARLNSTLRQVRNDVSHLDSLMPRIPAVLQDYLDSLTAHQASTRRDVGVSLDYSFPRIPAAILAEMAVSKAQHRDANGFADSGTESDTESDSRSSTSSSSSVDSSSSSVDSSSESSDSSSDDDHSSRSRQSASGSRSRPRRPRRRNSDRSSLRMHARRVTEPIDRKPQGRLRSATMAYPPNVGRSDIGGLNGGANSPSRPKPGGRGGSGFVQHADPLVVLERVLDELFKASTDLDSAAHEVVRDQEEVDGQISATVGKVDAAQKSIDQNNFQQLRMLEDHYFRLRTSLARPSSSFDFLWTGLSYALTVLFWLSWAVVTTFRLVRGVVFFPFFVLKWLLFLR